MVHAFRKDVPIGLAGPKSKISLTSMGQILPSMPDFDTKSRPYYQHSSTSLGLASELGFAPIFLGKELLPPVVSEIKRVAEAPLPRFPAAETQVPRESVKVPL